MSLVKMLNTISHPQFLTAYNYCKVKYSVWKISEFNYIEGRKTFELKSFLNVIQHFDTLLDAVHQPSWLLPTVRHRKSSNLSNIKISYICRPLLITFSHQETLKRPSGTHIGFQFGTIINRSSGCTCLLKIFDCCFCSSRTSARQQLRWSWNQQMTLFDPLVRVKCLAVLWRVAKRKSLSPRSCAPPRGIMGGGAGV